MKVKIIEMGLLALLLIFSLFATIGVSTVTTAGPKVYIDPALTENLCPGNTFTVTVKVDSDAYNLRAVKLDLVYDTTKFKVNNATVKDDLFGADNYLDLSNLSDDGELNIAIARKGAIYTPESGTLITVEFQVKDGVPDGMYALDLQDVVLKDEDNNNIPGVSVTDGTVVVQCTTPPACSDADFVLHLKAGWNLVSIPKPITPTDAVTLFNLSWPETAYYYDASSGKWINDCNIIVKPCQAYWVYKTKDEDICIYYDRSTLLPPSQQLYIGWNMIGHIDDTAWSIEDFLSVTGLENKCSIVCTVDHQGMPHNSLKLKCYYPTASGLSEFNTVLPGWGYWVFVKENILMPGTAP
ncbi:MAG: hypothetical protein J7L20_04410 [Thermoplasmata archaeon]|nr:hypothetical protein [Thermoplasmata archaeon]